MIKDPPAELVEILVVIVLNPKKAGLMVVDFICAGIFIDLKIQFGCVHEHAGMGHVIIFRKHADVNGYHPALRRIVGQVGKSSLGELELAALAGDFDYRKSGLLYPAFHHCPDGLLGSYFKRFPQMVTGGAIIGMRV